MKPEEIREMSSKIIAGSRYKKSPDDTNNAPARENRESVIADEVDAGDYDSSLMPSEDGYTITLTRKKK